MWISLHRKRDFYEKMKLQHTDLVYLYVLLIGRNLGPFESDLNGRFPPLRKIRLATLVLTRPRSKFDKLIQKGWNYINVDEHTSR